MPANPRAPWRHYKDVIPCERRKPDADLVREALLGSLVALAELLTRHWDTAVFLSARVLQSTELARDAAQEAAIAAMTDLGRLRSPERFGAWFCGIASRAACANSPHHRGPGNIQAIN